jgi:hypothetical protein
MGWKGNIPLNEFKTQVEREDTQETAWELYVLGCHIVQGKLQEQPEKGRCPLRVTLGATKL